MHGLVHWIWSSWDAIWPNLAANVLWIPIAWAYHVLMKRHVSQLQDAHEQNVRGLHDKIDELSRKVVGDEPAGS